MKPKGKEKTKEKPKEPSEPNKGQLKELRQEIEDLRKEKDELFERLQRVSADYSNFQKRMPKQISDAVNYEKENIIKSLLPAIDNFEHTLQNTPSAENVNVLVEAIRIIYEQTLDILKSHEVEQIKALGESFDPALHQAMLQEVEADKRENIVLKEFQKGYKLNGRVIRPSKVVVNKLQAKEEKVVDLKQPNTDEG